MNNRKNIEINRFDFGAASRGRRFSCKLADQKNHGQKQKSRQATKKSQKKRREEKIRKRQSENKRKKPTRNTSHKHQTPLPHHSRVKPEQRTATLPTKQRTYGTKTQQSNEPQQPIHQQSHHPEWLISTNIRHITRYDVISRNEQTGRLTNKQQKTKNSQ